MHDLRTSWRLAAGIVSFAVLLAACGGSSKHSTTVKGTAPTHKAKRTTARHLTEKIVVSGSGLAAAPIATARAGQTAEFVTQPPGLPGGPAVNVHLRIARLVGGAWTVSASVGGQTSTARLQSATGKPMPLSQLRYSCTLPPAPSFCPARRVMVSGTTTHLQFSSGPSDPIQLLATVGPPPPTHSVAPGVLVVAPFAPTETVAVRPARGVASSTKPTPVPSATVKPGDELLLRTRLSSHVKGGVAGAPQPVTVTINQGPANALRVTAAVAGGSASAATVSGAGGATIELVGPRFTCYLPPTPTFCPPVHVAFSPHRYALTFMASPRTSQVELIVHVQAA